MYLVRAEISARYGLSNAAIVQTSTVISISFMEALQGGQRSISVDLGPQIGRREIPVEFPAGVQNGQQMLLENAFRKKSLRVNLVVQVCLPSAPKWRVKPCQMLISCEWACSEPVLGGNSTDVSVNFSLIRKADMCGSLRLPPTTAPDAVYLPC
jgi:hypothetical protein